MASITSALTFARNSTLVLISREGSFKILIMPRRLFMKIQCQGGIKTVFFYISKLLPVSLRMAYTGLAVAAYTVVVQTVNVRFSCLQVIIIVFTTILEFPGLHSTYLNVNTRWFCKVHLLSFTWDKAINGQFSSAEFSLVLAEKSSPSNSTQYRCKVAHNPQFLFIP